MNGASPIIMHINYCEQGQTIADACRKAVAWGFDGIELRSRKQLAAAEPPTREETDRYLDEVAAAVSTAGLREVIFGYPGPDLILADDSRRAAQVRAYAEFCEMAVGRLRVKLFNATTGFLKHPDPAIPFVQYAAHGSALADERLWQQVVKGFRPLATLAEQLGFIFAFETHGGFLHDLPHSARELIQRIRSPAVGANLDYGTMSIFPQPPALAEAMQTLAGKIYYVHLKNLWKASDGSWTMASLADGIINNRLLLAQLRARGYAGPLCLEAPRDGDREWFAQQDRAYLGSILRDLGWTK